MAVEAAVAVVSGILARSITLIAFGLDGVIELASAGVLIWRLSSELRFGREVAESAKRNRTADRRRFAVCPRRLCRRGGRPEHVARRGHCILVARSSGCRAGDPDHARIGAA